MLNDFFSRDVSFIEQIEEAYQLAISKFGFPMFRPLWLDLYYTA